MTPQLGQENSSANGLRSSYVHALQHVLPQGFKRIRHYGLLANCHKKKKLAACRLALHAPEPEAVIESLDAFLQRVAHVEVRRCTHCATGMMRITETIATRRSSMPQKTGPPP